MDHGSGTLNPEVIHLKLSYVCGTVLFIVGFESLLRMVLKRNRIIILLLFIKLPQLP